MVTLDTAFKVVLIKAIRTDLSSATAKVAPAAFEKPIAYSDWPQKGWMALSRAKEVAVAESRGNVPASMAGAGWR